MEDDVTEDAIEAASKTMRWSKATNIELPEIDVEIVYTEEPVESDIWMKKLNVL